MLISSQNLEQEDNTSSSNNENEFQELDNEIEKVVRGETSYEEDKNEKNNVDLNSNNNQNTPQTLNNNYLTKKNNNYFSIEEEKNNLKNIKSNKRFDSDQFNSLNFSHKLVNNSMIDPDKAFFNKINYQNNLNKSNFKNNSNNNNYNKNKQQYNANNNNNFESQSNINNNNINGFVLNNNNNKFYNFNKTINNVKFYNCINNINNINTNQNYTFDTLNNINTQFLSNLNNYLLLSQLSNKKIENDMNNNTIINNQIFSPININLQFTNNNNIDSNQSCQLLNNFITNSLNINGFNGNINNQLNHCRQINNNINHQYGLYPFNINQNINYQQKINNESIYNRNNNIENNLNNYNNFMGLLINNNKPINNYNYSTKNNNNNIMINNNKDRLINNNNNQEKNGNNNSNNNNNSIKRKIFNPLSDSEKEKNIINLMDIFQYKDLRTTLMIKNIPNKYTISSFLEEINENFKNTYDIFYLPIDYINKCNLGFAFINFIEPFHIILFYELYRGKKWKKFNSDKICELLYAKFQGRKELIAHFEKGKVLTFETEDKRPLILPVPHQFPKINLPFYYLDLFIKLYPYISYKIKNNNNKNNLFSKFFTINGNFHKNKKMCE